MKVKNTIQIGDLVKIAREIDMPHVTFEMGDIVRVIEIEPRGYGFQSLDGKYRAIETGWDSVVAQ